MTISLSVVKRYPLIEKHSEKYGGGGHIHFRLKKDSLKTLRNLFIDVTNRPYLNWIFNEYCDNISAESLVFNREFYGNNPAILYNKSFSEVNFDMYGIAKGYAVRFDSGRSWFSSEKPSTVELRFFDAPASLQESIDHIDFANSYLNYIDKISKQNKLVNLEISTEEQIYKLTKDDKCIDEFYKLLKILGLSRRRYKKYIDTNYEWRKQSGFWTIKEGE
jgi:hypothetical protein